MIPVHETASTSLQSTNKEICILTFFRIHNDISFKVGFLRKWFENIKKRYFGLQTCFEYYNIRCNLNTRTETDALIFKLNLFLWLQRIIQMICCIFIYNDYGSPVIYLNELTISYNHLNMEGQNYSHISYVA